MSSFEKARCYVCKDIIPRFMTLIVSTPKGKFRVCQDCYRRIEMDKMNERYQTTKDNIKTYNLKDIDAYKVIKEREKFLKDIKEGKLNRGKT